MKRLDKEFTAVFERAPEGGYAVYVPALPGCISEGNTFEEAEANIREAIALYLGENPYLKDSQLEAFTVPVRV